MGTPLPPSSLRFKILLFTKEVFTFTYVFTASKTFKPAK